MTLPLLHLHAVPPHDEQAERNVLGCALASIQPVIAALEVEAFYSVRHRAAWAAVVDARGAGLRPDVHFVLDQLQREEKMNGWHAADVLELGNVCPTGANAEYYAGRVRAAWERRRLVVAADDAARAAYDPSVDANELRARLSAAAPASDLTAARASVADLATRARADPGAPFTGESLRALSVLRGGAADDYQRTRRALKDAGVRVTDLDRGVAQQASTERDMKPENVIVRAPAPGEIRVSTDVTRMIDEAEAALAALDRYHRSGELVRLVEVDARLRIAVLPLANLLADLSSAAMWTRVKGEDVVPTLPPKEVVAALHSLAMWPKLRELRAVVDCPTMRADGTVCQEQGYDVGSRTLRV